MVVEEHTDDDDTQGEEGRQSTEHCLNVKISAGTLQPVASERTAEQQVCSCWVTSWAPAIKCSRAERDIDPYLTINV